MENKAFITEIVNGDNGSCIIGIVEKGKKYKISFESRGYCTFRLMLVDTNGTVIKTINRIIDVIDEYYEYVVVPSADGYITYHTNGRCKIENITLTEV